MTTRTPPLLFLAALVLAASAAGHAGPAPATGPDALPYPIVDTAQERTYDDRREVAYPAPGRPFFGQDAQYVGYEPAYEDNGDGTVTDLVTRLTWQRDPGAKKTWAEAVAGAARCRLGGHADWRLPGIKELYSLIRFDGTDPDPRAGGGAGQRPFLDPDVFAFRYGDVAAGERLIDAQYVSATRYTSTTMHGEETVFGVNFADGRIKGYGLRDPRGGGGKRFFVLLVRGNPAYGRNDFADNGDGTIADRATGLTWTKGDSGSFRAGAEGDGRLDWAQALRWAEGLVHAGHDDWRLPNAKELQSIVDYGRSPDATHSPALDAVFETTVVRNETGGTDYPCYWTSTTHASLHGGSAGVYVAFGRAGGWMRGPRGIGFLDVHGAGAQRSDPKSGTAADYPHGRGPQGDAVRILNFARCVRGGRATPRAEGPPLRPVAPPPDGQGPRDGEASFVGRLDRDGDGRVSRTEFDGPPDHFDRLDRDHDGFLTAEEAPPHPPPGALPPPPPR